MRVLTFTFVTLLAGTAAAQNASPKAAAEALYRAGQALMSTGDPSKYPEACDKFAASENLDPSTGGHLNLANCLQAIGKTASAWVAYKEASSLAREAHEPARQAAADKGAKALEGELSKIRILAPADQQDLEIQLDGLSIQSAMRAVDLPVDPGNHVLEAKAKGKVSYKTTIAVNPHGDKKTVTIPLLEPDLMAASVPPVPGAAAPAASGAPLGPATGPAPVQEAPKASMAPWIIGGVGLVGLGLGAALAFVVHGDETTSKNECNAATLRCTPEGLSAANSGRTLGPISTAGFIVGGIGVGLAATLLIVRTPGKAKSGAAATVGIGPTVTSGSAGWRLQGSW